ncbi:berberine bridge enzyme-like 17 [Euphorbia lathyris]|uniref:berberine bridge enzyme-like 17 n=1 Tax=Euphorbia lathyris TaxID=212925 RepID=UPI0033144395
MKILITLCSLLTLLATASSSNPVVDNFLQCLPNHINHSIPIQDAIFTPNNSSFQQVLETYIKNRRFLNPRTPKPVAIITALHESHIQATINCAKDNSLQIRIRSGGHDFEGLSYRSNTSFVILDMFNLRSIDIDIASETAWVQSGAILGELYYQISKLSKVHAFPAGVCSSLGVGGHFSGGGYGNLMRKYGLSVDNVIDAIIVDFNGNIYDRKSMGEDLFWAIRGGGGASFGVILSWKIKLVRVPSIVTVFKVPRTLEQGGTDIFYKWQQVSTEIDKELYIRAQPEIQNPRNETEKKTVRISFIGQFLGQKSKLLSIMKNKFPELDLQAEDCQEVSWVESAMFWDNFPIGTPPEVILNRTVPAQIFFKTKSDYVKQIIPKKDLEKIWEMFMKTEGMIMQWNPYGGRMKEISDTEIAFPHRKGYLFKIQYLTMWFVEGEEVEESHIKLAREMYDGMVPYASKDPREAFLNYRDLDIGSNPSNETNFEQAEVYGRKYFKNNFVKLTEVKKRVDPDNFFKNEQSIPPAITA